MRGLLADVNFEGYLATMVRLYKNPPWDEFWEHANIESLTFANVGLPITYPDSDLWEFCQREELLLVTANQNADGPESLEATIRSRTKVSSLPVVTLAKPEWFRRHRDYRHRAAIQILEIVLDVDRVRGTGRLYIPSESSP